MIIAPAGGMGHRKRAERVERADGIIRDKGQHVFLNLSSHVKSISLEQTFSVCLFCQFLISLPAFYLHWHSMDTLWTIECCVPAGSRPGDGVNKRMKDE